MTRLETIDLELASQLSKLSLDRQRAAALASCFEAAVEQPGFPLDTIGVLRDIFRDQLPEKRKPELQILAERLDDEYLTALDESDQEESPDVMRKFASARLAAAIHGIATATSSADVAEAIYEAAFAVADQSLLLRTLRARVGSL
ncbi:MAG: hypothetical protein IT450_01105 [Phycisphaerales bacterium]|nr:hypothetical protein [Phycisphaerales bacterium]